MVTVSDDCNWPSLAVSRSTNVPAFEKVAVVVPAPALAKVTVPAPETLVQVVVTDPGVAGNPDNDMCHVMPILARLWNPALAGLLLVGVRIPDWAA